MTDTSLPPFSQEAEEAVIGCVLIGGDSVFSTLRDILRPRHFFLTRLRVFWQAFDRLADKGLDIDLTAIKTELEEMGQFDESGKDPLKIDYVALVKLANQDIDSMHGETYARLVHKTSLRRDMLAAADVIRQDALSEAVSVESGLMRMDRAALDLQRDLGLANARVVTMDSFTTDLLAMTFENEARYKANPNYVVGVRTGLIDLDLMLDGLQPGITTLAAATGLGKTGFALQIARFAAQRGLLRELVARPARVHFFSGEMTQRQLGVRMLSAMTGVPGRHIQRGSYTPQQKGLIEDALEELDTSVHLTLEPGARINTNQLRQRVRAMVLDNDLDLLVLDGLLQIEAVKIDPRDSLMRQSYVQRQRRDLIEEIMSELESLTLIYKLPILMTHQISRAPSGRADKRPVITDLAEASFVDHKSAVILFLYRDGYYTRNAADTSAEIICQKNRFGADGTVTTIYDAQYTRFLDTEHFDFGDAS